MSRVRGWTIAVLAASGVEILALITMLAQIRSLGSLVEAFVIDPSDDGAALDAAARSVDSIGLLVVVASVAEVVAVIGWLHACVKAVGDLGLGPLRHSSGWAIGAWFVPFLNLVRVPQIVADVHRAGRRRIAPVGLVVGVWWALWLGAVAFDRIAGAQRAPDTVAEVRQVLALVSTSAVVDVISALATIGLVLLVSAGLRDAAAAPPAHAWPAPQPHLAAYPAPGTAFGTPAPAFGTPVQQYGTPPGQAYAAPDPRFGTQPVQTYPAPGPAIGPPVSAVPPTTVAPRPPSPAPPPYVPPATATMPVGQPDLAQQRSDVDVTRRTYLPE